MLLDNSERIKKIQLFLKEVNVPFNESAALLKSDNYMLEFPFHSNLVYLINRSCFSCPVDCFKRFPIQFNKKFDKEIGKIKKVEIKNKDFNEKEIEFLSRVLLLNDKPMSFFDFEKHELLLEENLTNIEFYILGRRFVGKSTIYSLIPGDNNENKKEWESKINNSFPPLKLKVFKLNSEIFEKNYIPPYLQNDLITAYMFIIVSNSTTKNVMDVKNVIHPLLQRVNPDSLQICIANMQDKEHVMRGEAIENLTKIRTYELIATDPKCKERLMKIIYETILIRIEQMKENECHFFKNLTTTSQL